MSELKRYKIKYKQKFMEAITEHSYDKWYTPCELEDALLALYEDPHVIDIEYVESLVYKRSDQMHINEQVLKRAISVFGSTRQMVMLFEEMSELQKEICKNFRGNQNKDHITEEYADVLIMMKTLQIFLNISNDEIQKMIDFKIDRLNKRIESKMKPMSVSDI